MLVRTRPSTAAILEESALSRRGSVSAALYREGMQITAPVLPQQPQVMPGWVRGAARDSSRQWAQELLTRDPSSVLILDIESTGLEGSYVVEIAAIDLAGRPVLEQRLHPDAPIEAEATAVHGITVDEITTSPRFADLAGTLNDALTDHLVLTYNLAFDSAVLRNELRRMFTAAPDSERRVERWMGRADWDCLMSAYAAWTGHWDASRRCWKSPKLNGGHTALGDCRTALDRLHEMATRQHCAAA